MKISFSTALHLLMLMIVIVLNGSFQFLLPSRQRARISGATAIPMAPFNPKASSGPRTHHCQMSEGEAKCPFTQLAQKPEPSMKKHLVRCAIATLEAIGSLMRSLGFLKEPIDTSLFYGPQWNELSPDDKFSSYKKYLLSLKESPVKTSSFKPLLRKFMSSDISSTFGWTGENMMKGSKAIHQKGAISGVTAEFYEDSQYTGLFAESSVPLKGLLRISSATDPSVDNAGNSFITPGIGFKLFRNNQTSVAFVAMPSLQPQKNQFNLFDTKLAYRTHVDPNNLDIGPFALGEKFKRVTSLTNAVGLGHFTESNIDGKPESPPIITPYELILRPTKTAEEKWHCDGLDFVKALVDTPKLLKVFKILAIRSYGAEPEEIGQITLDEDGFMPVGNEAFFPHRRFTEDNLDISQDPKMLSDPSMLMDSLDPKA